MSAKTKTDSTSKEKLVLPLVEDHLTVLARVPAVVRPAWRLVRRRRYVRGRRLVRDDLSTVQAGTRTVFAEPLRLRIGAGVAPFRAYGSPHS
ncbi:hypothetical protein [Streptomyces sp. NPDC098781]|uniref:hypothetical protein n=1 Tax=Streptomyces sp. NPDC098781 TaxID=3366097 RepID=UPI0037F686CE